MNWRTARNRKHRRERLARQRLDAEHYIAAFRRLRTVLHQLHRQRRSINLDGLTYGSLPG
jgi:hypothetical protein